MLALLATHLAGGARGESVEADAIHKFPNLDLKIACPGKSASSITREQAHEVDWAAPPIQAEEHRHTKWHGMDGDSQRRG